MTETEMGDCPKGDLAGMGGENKEWGKGVETAVKRVQ